VTSPTDQPEPGGFDRFQRRHAWVGLPLAVAYKYFEDQGTYLAALVTYYGFVSLFPLLLLFVAVLGLVLPGHPGLQTRLVHSALGQFPIIGSQIKSNLHSERGDTAGVVIALVVAFYGGLGVAEALQNAMNRAWAVPRFRRPNPLRSRIRSFGLLNLLAVGAATTTGLSALDTSAAAFGATFGLSAEFRVATTALSVLINVGLFIVAFRLLTAHAVTTRQVLPGAVAAALSWQVLQSVGTYYVGHALKGSSQTFGVFGVVLGLLAWLLVTSIVVVVSAELNVVLARQLWPRGALSMVSENAILTDVDRRAYQFYAGNERYRGFVEVALRVDPDQEGRPSTDAAPANAPPAPPVGSAGGDDGDG
jgi:membrane protein